MKLVKQSYGANTLLFIISDSKQEAYEKYVSLFNWGAVNSHSGSLSFDEIEWVKDGIISVWTTEERLKNYLFNTNLMRLLNSDAAKYKGKSGGAKEAALAAAEQEYNLIQHEEYRTVNSKFESHIFGSVSAERPDEDLRDYFVARGFQSKGWTSEKSVVS